MTVGETIALFAVLLLSLYGASQGIVRVSLWLLRPKRERMLLLLPMKGRAEDAEQQLRYARALCGYWRFRKQPPYIVVYDCGMGEEARRITEMLLVKGDGCLLEAEEFKKTLSDACADAESGV